MPAKNTNSKQTTKAVASTPAPVETAPAQKGGKKTVAKVETAPVVETPVEVAPAPTKAQKGGKSKAVAPAVVETAPVVEATQTKAQKGGKSKAAAPAVVETAPVVEATPAKKGAKKAATAPVVETAPVVAVTGGAKSKKVATKKVVETPVEATEAEETGDRRIRSFKVKLPGSEEFEGRFTGLTPYQAANKALSKYFRETEKPQAEITFSICESTRKSRKATYTYVGRRQKLDTPVTYTIQDGREIVKNFKNSLKKVKKSEAVSESA